MTRPERIPDTTHNVRVRLGEVAQSQPSTVPSLSFDERLGLALQLPAEVRTSLVRDINARQNVELKIQPLQLTPAEQRMSDILQLNKKD